MKELNNRKPTDISHVKKKEHKKSLTKVGTLNPHRNHTAFEYNKRTGELVIAQYAQDNTIQWKDAVAKNYSSYKRILQKPDCIYLTALNKPNAIKVLKRDYGIDAK